MDNVVILLGLGEGKEHRLTQSSTRTKERLWVPSPRISSWVGFLCSFLTNHAPPVIHASADDADETKHDGVKVVGVSPGRNQPLRREFRPSIQVKGTIGPCNSEAGGWANSPNTVLLGNKIWRIRSYAWIPTRKTTP